MTTVTYTPALEGIERREISVDISEYKRICEMRKPNFEKTPDDRPIKLYCDFDFKAKHAVEGFAFYDCTNELVELTKKHMNEQIEMLGGKVTPKYAVKIATKIEDSVLSFHLICTNYKMTKKEQSVFFENVERLIENDSENNWRKDYLDAKPDAKFFDMSVYSHGRFMRSSYSNKSGGNRYFEIAEGTFEDTVISFDNHNAETLSIPIPQKKIGNANILITQNNGEDTIQKYIDYMEIIPPSKWNDYLTWFKIQRASANIGIPFEIYDQFMKSCQGYDYDNNKRTYEMPSDDKNGRIGWGFIYETAYAVDPVKKGEIDEKYKSGLFCKFKFASIKAPETEDIKQLYKDLDLAKLKEKKGEIKEITSKIKLLQDLENYKMQKVYFEKFHFKCMHPPCYVRKTEQGYDMLSHEKIGKLYINLNGFIEMWLKDMFIREVESCDFNPPPMINKNNQFNLYTGMEYETIRIKPLTPEEIKLNSRIFIKHLWFLSGKNNKVLEYLLNYFAHMLQYPAELPRTSIVFKSVQGVGKSIFLEKFGTQILGEKYLLSTTKIDDILGRFPQISQKFLVIMDETNPKDSFMANENIKSFITSPTLTYEKKGVDGIQIKNCGRMIFLTNNDYPVKIEQSDRRFIVVECSSEIKNNTVYFKALNQAFNNEILVKSFALFLKNRDISKFDPTNDRPITEVYKSIQTATIPLEQRFFSENTNLPYGETQTGKDIFNLYSDWIRYHGKKPIAEQTFLTRLKNYEFIEKIRDNNVRKYVINEEAHLKYIEQIESSLEVKEDEENEYPDIY